jgi:hypothetical protein
MLKIHMLESIAREEQADLDDLKLMDRTLKR